VIESDVTKVIAGFVVETDSELAARMEDQAAALGETPCTAPAAFGRWVDANDVKLLFSAFALEDKDFTFRFPAMQHLTAAERQKFIADLEVHFETCKHCALKRGYDLELDARIKKVCQQNNKLLLQLLREEENESAKEGEHLTINFEPAI
jgi:hypothetical protein